MELEKFFFCNTEISAVVTRNRKTESTHTSDNINVPLYRNYFANMERIIVSIFYKQLLKSMLFLWGFL